MTIEACEELLLSLALRSTCLAALIYVVLKLCERRSAPFRCALLTSGMIGLAILPLSWCLPRIETTLSPDLSRSLRQVLTLASRSGAA